jgi:hypothetical protein
MNRVASSGPRPFWMKKTAMLATIRLMVTTGEAWQGAVVRKGIIAHRGHEDFDGHPNRRRLCADCARESG